MSDDLLENCKKPTHLYKEEQPWFPLSNVMQYWDKDFHDLMNQDKVRMTSYKNAIVETITDFHRQRTDAKVIRVMDIGTGTGILSELIAEHWIALCKAKPSSCRLVIYPVEFNSYMAATAELNLKEINADPCVVISPVIKRSSYDIDKSDFVISSDQDINDVETLNLGADNWNCIDLIVSELLGNLGDNEDMVGILSHAKARFLRTDDHGVMIPKKVEQYLVPISSNNLYYKMRDGNIESLSTKYVKLLDPKVSCIYCDAVIPDSAHLCAKPNDPIIQWDFDKAKSLVVDYDQPSQFDVTKNGDFHGFKTYFKAFLTDQVVLDLSPETDFNIPSSLSDKDELGNDAYSNRNVSDCWKHGFLGISSPIKVEKGNIIKLTYSRKLSDDHLTFTYKWEGRVMSGENLVTEYEEEMEIDRPHVQHVSGNNLDDDIIKLELLSHEYPLRGSFLMDEGIFLKEIKSFFDPSPHNLGIKYDDDFYETELIEMSDERLKNEDLFIGFPLHKDDIKTGCLTWANYRGKFRGIDLNKLDSNDWIIYYKLTVTGDETKDVAPSDFIQVKCMRYENLPTISDGKTYFITLFVIPSYILSKFSPSEFRELKTAYLMFEERIIVEILKKEAGKHQLKSSVTAIMSRNLSHNIGSHVISYWNIKIEETLSKKKDTLKDELQEHINEELSKRKTPDYFHEQRMIKTSKELLQYIQHRMDFIAEISTSVPCSEMSLDIKKDIVDPVIAPNNEKYGTTKELSAMLKYIAHSEGIDFHNKIYLDIAPEIEKKGQRVSIPNGIIGAHAVYSILENFIRNAAKHYKGEDSALLFSHDRIDCNDIKHIVKDNFTRNSLLVERLNDTNDCISVLNGFIQANEFILEQSTLHRGCDLTEAIEKLKKQYNNDELSNSRKMEINREVLEEILGISDTVITIEIREPTDGTKYADDYYVVRLWDMRENSCNSIVVESLSKYFPGCPDAVFSKEGQLKLGGWGIKEMITCANFLRKNTPDDLYDYLKDAEKKDRATDNEIPPLFSVLCHDKATCIKGNGCERTDAYKNKLGIEFYIRKPKDLCITVDTVQPDGTLFGIDPLDKYKDKEIPHRMLLVASADQKKYEDDPTASCRVLPMADEAKVDDKKYVELYEKYIKKEIYKEQNLPKFVSIGGGIFLGGCNDIDNAIDDKIYFVHHLPTDENTVFLERNDANELIFTELLDTCLYVQPVSGGYSTNAKLTIPPTDPLIKKHFCLELIESAITKVIIVDERISEWAQRDYAHGKKIRDILHKMGIFVVEVSREDMTYDELKRKIDPIKSKCKNSASFFVIHQGILDKLKENSKDKELMQDINDYFRWKVIDSGRGVPEKLRDYDDFKVRFVEISALQRLIENYDKHGLVQMLFSTRRPPDNNIGRNKDAN